MQNQILIETAMRVLDETIPPSGYVINGMEVVDVVSRNRVSVRTFDGDIKGSATIVQVSISDVHREPIGTVLLSVTKEAKTILAVTIPGWSRE